MSRFALATLVVVACAVGAAAQQPAAAQLTAEQILDRFVDATGGREARAKHSSLVVRGNVEVVGAGINGLMESYAVAPNKFATTVVLAGLGTVRDVYDGTRGWESSALNGVRELEGAELAILRRQAMFDADANWRELWGSADLVGRQDLEGRSVYVVRLRPKEEGAGELKNYYDAETFLLVRSDSTMETASASIPVVTTYSDYRTVDGVKLPFLSEQQIPTGRVRVTATAASFDVKVDDAVFARPVAH